MTHKLLPQLIFHYDWSINPKKRAVARAELSGETYLIYPPELVDQGLSGLLLPEKPNQTTFIGFDVPFGLPHAYTEQIGCENFLDLLPMLGRGEWADFFNPAMTEDEISRHRPFYPQRPGGSRRNHLVEALGVEHFDQLRRECDRATPYRSAAAALFWTMGAQQVGKAAISVWRDVLQPALAEPGQQIGVWPFDGELGNNKKNAEGNKNNQRLTGASPNTEYLAQLLNTYAIVIAEVYPGEMIHHIGIQVRSKRDQAERAKAADTALAWVEQHGWRLTPAAERALRDGFGSAADGEDRFDAFVGMLGMLGVLAGTIPEGGPAAERVRRVEGGILGCATQ